MVGLIRDVEEGDENEGSWSEFWYVEDQVVSGVQGLEWGFWKTSMWCLQERSRSHFNHVQSVLDGFIKDVEVSQAGWKVTLNTGAGDVWRKVLSN